MAVRIELDIWNLVTLGVTMLGATFSFGKILVSQFERRLHERFLAQDEAREQGQKAIRSAFEQHIAEERQNQQALQNLEREFLVWKADLPIHYVRREDYVRGQSVLEAKLDALYNKIEVVQLKGATNA